MVGDDDDLRGSQRGVHLGGVGTAVQVVFQNHDGVGLARGQLLQSGFDGLAAEQCQTEAVGFRNHQAE
ncbi:hypothetical protein D3C78_1051090 [compost metagenome]